MSPTAYRRGVRGAGAPDEGVTPPPPPVGNGAPKGLPSGITMRSYAQCMSSEWRPLIDGVIYSDVSWAELQPTNGATLSSSALTALEAALDRCNTERGTSGQPLNVCLRIDPTQPAWLKAQCGAIEYWRSRPSVSQIPGGVCPWWHNDNGLWDAHHNLHDMLSSRLGDHPRLTVVTAFIPAVWFNEPCVHFFGSQTIQNRAAVMGRADPNDPVPAGFTPWSEAAEDASFEAAWQIHMDTWGAYDVACETSYNPIDGIIARGSTWGYVGGNVARTIRLMERQVAMQGRLALLANHSLTPVSTGVEGQMIQRQQELRRRATPFPVAVAHQTETWAKLTSDDETIAATIEHSLTIGDAWVEPPVGSQAASAGSDQITPAKAAAWNTRFRANMLPLVAPSSPGDPDPPDPGDPWATRDSATWSANDPRARYFIAGTLYGDPQGNDVGGVITVTSSSNTHLKRNLGAQTTEATVRQLGAAFAAIGGTAAYSNPTATQERVVGNLPAGNTLTIDLDTPLVRWGGTDMFGLSQVGGVWTTTATGPQVRAFLAGVMQGEGNLSGKVADDDDLEHIQLIQRLLATAAAYSVPATVTGATFRTLTIDDEAYFARVQAYPFSRYARCPGGNPDGASYTVTGGPYIGMPASSGATPPTVANGARSQPTPASS